MTEIVLAVDKLTVYRGTNAAVEEISFTLAAGVDLAIIGPNGAGKSTLVQAILGIVPRQAGEVSILGHPLNGTQSLPLAVRQQVAYLPQNFSFDRRIPLTVQEFVGLGWEILEFQLPWVGNRRCARSVAEALERVDASHLRHQLISGLSGGEIKRVLLGLLITGLSGLSPEEIILIKPDFIQEIGLNIRLTPSRSNGFYNIFQMMQKKALIYLRDDQE